MAMSTWEAMMDETLKSVGEAFRTVTRRFSCPCIFSNVFRPMKREDTSGPGNWLRSENLDIDPSRMHREIDAGDRALGYSLIDLFQEISGIRKFPGTVYSRVSISREQT